MVIILIRQRQPRILCSDMVIVDIIQGSYNLIRPVQSILWPISVCGINVLGCKRTTRTKQRYLIEKLLWVSFWLWSRDNKMALRFVRSVGRWFSIYLPTPPPSPLSPFLLCVCTFPEWPVGSENLKTINCCLHKRNVKTRETCKINDDQSKIIRYGQPAVKERHISSGREGGSFRLDSR